jgi:hypothetical protein
VRVNASIADTTFRMCLHLAVSAVDRYMLCFDKLAPNREITCLRDCKLLIATVAK